MALRAIRVGRMKTARSLANSFLAPGVLAAAVLIDMSADEKVTTVANDRAHLVFLDGTSPTVGPNSAVVIDKFVFDPRKKTGEMALTVGRGTMRFVGGVISKTPEFRVKIHRPVSASAAASSP